MDIRWPGLPYEQRADTRDTLHLWTQVDFISQQLVLATSGGRRLFIDLIPRTVADFHAAGTTQLRALDVDVTYSTAASELPDPVPFEQDTAHRAYDGAAARRWWLAMVSVGQVMDRSRTPFGGKSNPVLFYWGGFDLNHAASAAVPHPPGPAPG